MEILPLKKIFLTRMMVLLLYYELFERMSFLLGMHAKTFKDEMSLSP